MNTTDMNNKNTNFKFLLLGAGRGGTSLLMALLDSHSKLEVASEFATQSHLMGRGFNCQTSDIFSERVTAFHLECVERAKQTSNMVWGNKITTEQLLGLEDHNSLNIDNQIDIMRSFFLDVYKDYKKIFILRDGRSCVSSKVNRTGQSMSMACKRWNYSVSVYQFLNTFDENSTSVKFEYLLKRPDAELNKICKFLDLEFEDEMLNGVLSDKLMPEYQHGGFITEKAKIKKLPEEYFALIEPQLKACGYI